MIRSFEDRVTEAIFHEKECDGLPMSLQEKVLQRLQLLNAAGTLKDLEAMPLCGLRPLPDGDGTEFCLPLGEHTRLCFRWLESAACDVHLRRDQ